MQIHEITLAKKEKIDEGLADLAGRAGAAVGGAINKAKGYGDKFASPFKAAGNAMNQAKIDRQVTAVSGKAYQAWVNYKNQLDKYYADSGKPAPANAYSSALINFVQKNLMGGTTIAQATNKADIIGLVKQISAAGQPKPAPAQQGAQQATVTIKPNQARAQATATPATTPQGQAPAQTQGRVPSTPAGAPRPVAPVQAPQANTTLKQKTKPAPSRTVQEATPAPQGDPAKEKQLFTQLVRAAALATPEVDMGDDDEVADNKPTTGQGVQTTTPADNSGSDEYVPLRPAERYALARQGVDQNNPSYYYKDHTGNWTNELGQPVRKPESIVKLNTALDAALKAGTGAKRERDPFYDPQYAVNRQPKTSNKKGSKKGRGRE
jgi:hypothetical protein